MSDLFGVYAIDMPISYLATVAVMPDNLMHHLLILKPWWWKGQSHLKENKCILIELDFPNCAQTGSICLTPYCVKIYRYNPQIGA